MSEPSLVQRLGHRPWFAAIGRRVMPRLDRLVHRVSSGRFVAGRAVLPTVIVVHTGAKTGAERRTPLSYVRTGSAYALAATNWGQAHHPAWSANLLANPDAKIETGGEAIPVRARLASVDEKAALWPRFVDIWPAYDTYVERSGRDIRVFILEPVR